MKLWRLEDSDSLFDLTPMIDVVFLLIVFFMTVANLLTSEKIQILMPVAEHSTIPEEYGGRSTVTVTPEGRIYAGMFAVEPEELTRIVASLKEEDPDLKVFLRADRNTEHQYVNDVLKACAEAGVYQVIFAAYQSDK